MLRLPHLRTFCTQVPFPELLRLFVQGWKVCDEMKQESLDVREYCSPSSSSYPLRFPSFNMYDYHFPRQTLQSIYG